MSLSINVEKIDHLVKSWGGGNAIVAYHEKCTNGFTDFLEVTPEGIVTEGYDFKNGNKGDPFSTHHADFFKPKKNWTIGQFIQEGLTFDPKGEGVKHPDVFQITILLWSPKGRVFSHLLEVTNT